MCVLLLRVGEYFFIKSFLFFSFGLRRQSEKEKKEGMCHKRLFYPNHHRVGGKKNTCIHTQTPFLSPTSPHKRLFYPNHHRVGKTKSTCIHTQTPFLPPAPPLITSLSAIMALVSGRLRFLHVSLFTSWRPSESQLWEESGRVFLSFALFFLIKAFPVYKNF